MHCTRTPLDVGIDYKSGHIILTVRRLIFGDRGMYIDERAMCCGMCVGGRFASGGWNMHACMRSVCIWWMTIVRRLTTGLVFSIYSSATYKCIDILIFWHHGHGWWCRSRWIGVVVRTTREWIKTSRVIDVTIKAYLDLNFAFERYWCLVGANFEMWRAWGWCLGWMDVIIM